MADRARMPAVPSAEAATAELTVLSTRIASALDVIYIQAKRWDGTVGRPEIQKFAGALQGQRAKKGIFITTSDFTKDANDYAAMIDSRIVLINGSRICNLMIDHGIGVTRATSYEVKRLDSDYFEES